MDSNLGNFVALGSYSILSAQEAWEKVLSPNRAGGELEIHGLPAPG
jgi:hypothetical protein